MKVIGILRHALATRSGFLDKFHWFRLTISEDGVKLPQIFVLEGANADLNDISNVRASQSIVVKINGQDVIDFLERDALQGLTGPDSAFNKELWSFGEESGGFFTSGAINYPGAETAITFLNGTTTRFRTRAFTSLNLWPLSIADGTSFFSRFCVDIVAASQQTLNATELATSAQFLPTCDEPASTSVPKVSTLAGYPYVPVVKDPNNNIAGYFLNEI
ncbi:MAG: hypothetical protein M1820_004348 [Bogoriella megaspora]|nr:MAG: hypothetical protein M1820_004348 [Bogoriella megaspora]